MLMRDRHRERLEFHRLLDQLRKGDVLVVWKLFPLNSFRSRFASPASPGSASGRNTGAVVARDVTGPRLWPWSADGFRRSIS
jgi:hypothetical protein